MCDEEAGRRERETEMSEWNGEGRKSGVREGKREVVGEGQRKTAKDGVRREQTGDDKVVWSGIM